MADDIDATREFLETAYEDHNDPSLCLPGQEHTGRWTHAEHELFLEALNKYGRVIYYINFLNLISLYFMK
jgi:hypothetical protein